MIRAIVVDDEWYNIEEISDLLTASGEFQPVRKYQNPADALNEAIIYQPQVAFVDIEMPVLDGITLAQKLQDINPDLIIVFVTSWNQYAVQAFDVNALDYILKPINTKRFEKTIKKVKQELNLLQRKKEKKIEISCFGKLVVLIDEVPVKWDRAKAQELFAFLLMNHNQYINKDTIIEQLWPEYDFSKALSILQTVVYSIRNTFSTVEHRVKLQYSQSKYCLTIVDANIDLFEFQEQLEMVRSGNQYSVVRLDYLKELCKKGFLSDHAYLWSFAKEEELKSELIATLHYLIKQDKKQKGKTQLIYLKLLAELMPYEDSIQFQLLQIYKNNGYESEARRHYHWLLHTLKEEYDAKPSRRIRMLLEDV